LGAYFFSQYLGISLGHQTEVMIHDPLYTLDSFLGYSAFRKLQDEVTDTMRVKLKPK